MNVVVIGNSVLGKDGEGKANKSLEFNIGGHATGLWTNKMAKKTML